MISGWRCGDAGSNYVSLSVENVSLASSYPTTRANLKMKAQKVFFKAFIQEAFVLKLAVYYVMSMFAAPLTHPNDGTPAEEKKSFFNFFI